MKLKLYLKILGCRVAAPIIIGAEDKHTLKRLSYNVILSAAKNLRRLVLFEILRSRCSLRMTIRTISWVIRQPLKGAAASVIKKMIFISILLLVISFSAFPEQTQPSGRSEEVVAELSQVKQEMKEAAKEAAILAGREEEELSAPPSGETGAEAKEEERPGKLEGELEEIVPVEAERAVEKITAEETKIQPTPRGQIIISPEKRGIMEISLRERLEQRGSFKFVDEDLRIALRSLAKAYGFNLTLAPEVMGKVTVDFKNVKVINALDNILKDHGFGYQILGDILRVTTLEKLRMEEEAEAVRKAAEAKKSQAEAAKRMAEEAAEPVLSKVFELKYIDASDALEVIKPMLTKDRGKAMVLKTRQFKGFEWEVATAAGAGKPGEEAEEFVRSRTLIVQDTPTVLKKISKVIEEIDKKPHQILIDAKIVEVPVDQEFRLGINWTQALNQWSVGADKLEAILERGYSRTHGTGYDQIDLGMDINRKQFIDSYINSRFKAPERSSISNVLEFEGLGKVKGMKFGEDLEGGEYEIGGKYLKESMSRLVPVGEDEVRMKSSFHWSPEAHDIIDAYINSVEDTLINLATSSQTYTAVLKAAEFNLMLSAMRTDSNIVMLSNPRIIVQENYAAKIHIGTRFPIIKTSVGEYGVGGASVEEWKEIGITLKVIPQVRTTESGKPAINMIVHPSVSSYTKYAPTATGQNSPYPIIDIRESDTNVTINNGDTVVVGGLINSTTVDEESKIPLLGDIPILGYLFKEEHTSLKKTNLLIFITARIVDETELSAFEKMMLEKVPPEALEDVRYVEDEDLRPYLYKSAKDPEVAKLEEPVEEEEETEGRKVTRAMRRNRSR